ncbi:MAG: hypothetical protein WC314_15785 [Vulcanimicrobiota bacterium]
MTDEDHWGLLASALSSFDRSEEDEDEVISLDLVEGVQPRAISAVGSKPISVHQGKRYLQMKSLVDALLAGQINKLAFVNRIKPIAKIQQRLVEIMDQPQTRERFSRLPEEEQALFRGVRRCLAGVGDQLLRMASSGETAGVEDVRVAMEEITHIYTELQALQERVTALGHGTA